MDFQSKGKTAECSQWVIEICFPFPLTVSIYIFLNHFYLFTHPNQPVCACGQVSTDASQKFGVLGNDSRL